MLGVDGFWRPLAAAPLLRGTSRRPVKSTTPGTRRPPRQIKSPQAFRIGSFVSEKLRGTTPISPHCVGIFRRSAGTVLQTGRASLTGAFLNGRLLSPEVATRIIGR